MKKHLKNTIDSSKHLLIGEEHGEQWDGNMNPHTMSQLKEILVYLISRNKKIKVFYEGLAHELSFPNIDFINLDERKIHSTGRSFRVFRKIWDKPINEIIIRDTIAQLYQKVVVALDSEIIQDYHTDDHSYDYTIYVVGGVHAVRIHDIIQVPMVLSGVSGNEKQKRKFIGETRERIRLFESH